MPYMSALYVWITGAVETAQNVTNGLICMPYMSALYVCLIRMDYRCCQNGAEFYDWVTTLSAAIDAAKDWSMLIH